LKEHGKSEENTRIFHNFNIWRSVLRFGGGGLGGRRRFWARNSWFRSWTAYRKLVFISCISCSSL